MVTVAWTLPVIEGTIAARRTKSGRQGTMAKGRDKGKREVKKKKKEKAPKGAPAPFSDAAFTPRREPGMPGSAGAPPA
jgi:hypothetical protein